MPKRPPMQHSPTVLDVPFFWHPERWTTDETVCGERYNFVFVGIVKKPTVYKPKRFEVDYWESPDPLPPSTTRRTSRLIFVEAVRRALQAETGMDVEGLSLKKLRVLA